MKLATLMAQKGTLTAIIVFCIALGTGHIMQTVLADQGVNTNSSPLVPNPPAETLVPVVLKTPPPPRLPETFG